jgi:hypothetical protein
MLDGRLGGALVARALARHAPAFDRQRQCSRRFGNARRVHIVRECTRPPFERIEHAEAQLGLHFLRRELFSMGDCDDPFISHPGRRGLGRCEQVTGEHQPLDGVRLVERELLTQIRRARLQLDRIGEALLPQRERGAEHELLQALRAALDVERTQAVRAQLLVARSGAIVLASRRRDGRHGAPARPGPPRKRRLERRRGWGRGARDRREIVLLRRFVKSGIDGE